MKLSKETLSVLKNFATINGNILIKTGNRLSTISAQKNVMASTTVSENFDSDFGIYDLNEFLGVYSLFADDPELAFDEKFVTVANGKSKVKYFAADPSVLASPTKDALPVDEDIKFDLSRSAYDMIMKTSSVLRSNDVSFIGKDVKFQSGTGYRPPRRILLWSFLKIADNLKAKPGILFFDAKDIISGYSFSLKLKIIFLNSLEAL